MGIRSDILGTRLNKVKNNLTKAEAKAIDTLIDFQRNGTLVLQPTDKSGGIGIFDREDYVSEIYDILNDTLVDPSSGTVRSYYKIVDKSVITEHHKLISRRVN